MVSIYGARFLFGPDFDPNLEIAEKWNHDTNFGPVSNLTCSAMRILVQILTWSNLRSEKSVLIRIKQFFAPSIVFR